MKKLFAAFAVVTLVTQACKKETPQPPEEPVEVFSGCRLIQRESGALLEKYILDDRNLAVECIITDNQGNVMSKTYEYVNGSLSVIKTYADKEKTQLSIVEAFSKVGDRITKVDEGLSNGTSTPFKRTDYTLNSKGSLQSREEYAFIDGKEFLSLRVEYETDTNGNITLERQYNPDSSLFRSLVYAYDDKKNVRNAEPAATILPVGKNNILSVKLLKADNTVQSEYHPQYQYNAEGYPVVEANRWVYNYQCR
jgi:hypothetical protein